MIKLLIFLAFFLATCLCIDTNRQFILHPTPISDISIKDISSSVGLMLCVQDDEKYAYISSAQNGVQIIDLSQIELPKIISKIPSGYAQHCAVKGDYLFIADQEEGLVIADVKDKLNPKRISQIAFTGIAGLENAKAYQYVTISPDFKYAFTLSYGFVFTYNIEDKANPAFTYVVADATLFAPNSYRIKFDKNYQYLAVSNHLTGVTVIDIRSIQNQKVRLLQNPSFVIWDCEFSPDNTAIFAVDIYFGVYYADPSRIFGFQQDADGIITKDINPLTFKNIIPPTDSLFMTMLMTSDGTHLLIGHRSTGLKLYKFEYDTVNNKFKYDVAIFIQHLNGNYMALSMFASPQNEKYIYVANGISFTVYQSVTPNINQDFPNFFNTFQSALIYQTPELSRFGLYCMKNNVIVSNPQFDIRIYDITDPYYPEQISSVSRLDPANMFDQITLFEVTDDEKTMYVTTATTGIITFDITDKTNLVKKDQYIFKNPQTGLAAMQATYARFSPNKNSMIISNSFYGAILLHNVQNNPLSQVTIMQIFAQNKACGIERCAFTSDGLKLVCACREVGTMFFTIGSDVFFSWQFLFNQIGCESLIISANDKLLYIANGFQGLFILDISDFTKPVQLSQLVLQGWANQVYTLFNEKYVIIAEVDKGQLSLINVEDPSNPYVQQRIQFLRESSTNLCIVPNSKSMYYLGNAGLRYQPILPDIKIHSQFQLSIKSSDGTFLYYQTLAEGQNLLVGQEVRVTFVPLYTEQNIKINDVKYYRYFEKQVLPTWITFLPSKGQVFISVNKLGAYNDFSTEKKGENILILEVFIEVKSSDLVRDQLISPELASHLISQLQQKGYLDFNGYVTSLFDPTVSFNVDFYNDVFKEVDYKAKNDEIQKVIKKALTFSKVDYPIRFFIVSSLVFNYKTSQSRLLQDSSTDVISTPSQQVSIFMQILSNGKFVKKVFEGVLASFSDDLTSVKISGQTSYVNNIMKKSIQVSNSTDDLSQVKITFLLSDSNNYDQTINISLKEVGFTQIHQPVVLEKSLQDQFNHYFTDGNLYIEERFQFSFDQNSFVQKDGLAITYKSYFLNGDEEPREIMTGEWLEFSTLSLGFSGIKTGSYFLDNYWIRVIATDGYSEAKDDFNMTFNKVPFFYAFQLIVSVVGPLLGILGLWKYRFEIHLFVAERKNMYKNEVANIGQMFKKQIILYGSVQQDAIKLWNILVKENKDLEDELINEYKLNKTIDIYNIISRLEKIYSSNATKYPLLDPREFDFDDSRFVRSIKRQAYEFILKNNVNTLKVYNLLRDYAVKSHGAKDWYKLYLSINPIMRIVNNEVIHRELDKNDENKEEKEKVQDYKFDNVIEGTEQNQLRLRLQSSFNRIDSNNKENDDLNTPKRGQVTDRNIQSAKYIDNPNVVKQVSTNNEQIFKQNDDDNRTNIQLYTNLNPFPEITINQEKIIDILQIKECRLQYDMNLLAEIIALEASGVQTGNPSGISPSIGESIHLFPHDLYTLQAFRKGKNQNCISRIMDFLNMSYSSIGLVKNNPLPKWINYSILDGIIHIWGVPHPSDESDILIRIINNTGFAIHSFHIFIKDFQGNDMRDKNLIRRATLHYLPSSRKNQGKLVHSSVNILSQSNRLQSPQMNKQTSNQNIQELNNKSLSNINSKSQFAIDFNAKLQGPSTHLNAKQLNQIEEERPEHLKEFTSNIAQGQGKQFEDKMKVDQGSSIIIEMDQSAEFKNKMSVKFQDFKNKPM